MNDHDPFDEPQFDDPAYDDVRHLLADARVTEPVPADVAARLDATLASLTAERHGAAHDPVDVPTDLPAEVVPLRRRSRLAPRLLAAAAAVVVVGAGGVGLSQVLSSSSSDSRPTAASDSGAEAPAVPELAPATPDAVPQDRAPAVRDLSKTLANGYFSVARTGALEFTAAGFPEEVAALKVVTRASLDSVTGATKDPDTAPPVVGDDGTPTSGTGAGSAPAPTYSETQRRSPFLRLSEWQSAADEATCAGPVGTGATIITITYEGVPAALAVHPADDFGQLVEAWTCDGSTVLASTVIPR